MSGLLTRPTHCAKFERGEREIRKGRGISHKTARKRLQQIQT